MSGLGHFKFWLAFAFIWAPQYAVPSFAQSCTPTITNIDFGEIDVTTNAAFAASGQYSIACSSFIGVSAIRTCPNVNAGSGGASGSGQPRYLSKGSDVLHFNLFSDPGYASVWGSRYWIGSPPTVDIPLNVTALGLIQIGTNSASRSVYARIPAGQQAVPPGIYSSTFLGSQTAVNYGGFLLDLPLLAPTCSSLTTPNLQAAFTVTATVVPNCTVTASNLDFGTTGILTAAVTASSALTVTCTATTPYTVALNGGASAATDPTQRRMTRGSERVVYGLYRDSSWTEPWGDETGLNTLGRIGTGFPQVHQVNGRVPPQATPSPGTYVDLIVATVTY